VPPLKDIVARLLTPLLYVNLAGLSGAALWLASLSQWQVMGIGVAMIFISPYIIPILVMPAGIFSHYMLAFREIQRPDKERTMLLCSLAYIVLFLTFWCIGIFDYVTASIHPLALHAGLLWASTASVSSLLWWSSRDRSNVLVMTLVEIAQVAMIAVSAIRLLSGGLSFWTAFAIFGGIAASLTALQVFYEEKYLNKAQ
jgi:hypothetical protein